MLDPDIVGPGSPAFADHLTILDDLDICRYVDTEDVKDVRVWMYHRAVVAPIESGFNPPVALTATEPWQCSNRNRTPKTP